MDNIQKEKENSIQEKEDNIRPPDKVIKERLIEDNRCEFQKQMDEALYNSLQELKEQDEMNMTYEEELIKIYNEQDMKWEDEKEEKYEKEENLRNCCVCRK